MPARSERGDSAAPTPCVWGTVLILSGGLDSSVLLYHLRADGRTVVALSFDYGQRHARELESAKRICELAGRTAHRIVNLRSLAPLFGNAALVDRSVPVPLGEYDEVNMLGTTVPNRNMIMLSIATAFALAQKASAVAFAAHSGQRDPEGSRTTYPDCRPVFVEALSLAVHLADWNSDVDLVAPFVRWTKADIVRRGVELAVPFEQTWSCYEGGELHCGECGTCRERRAAFAEAGVTDPTRYLR